MDTNEEEVMPEETSIERLNLLADVAEMYYMGKLSQQEIAKKIGLSRSMVSYLLEDAREKGVVEIRICRPISRASEVEYEFKKRFRLREVRIIERKLTDNNELMRILGRAGAEVLHNILYDGIILGLGWGVGVRAVVQALSPRLLPAAQVVQLTGGVGSPNRSVDGTEMTRRAAELLSATAFYMNAPVIVESGEVANALQEDHSIKEVLELGQKVEVALAGIGTTDYEGSSQYQAGYLSKEELSYLESLGVVGDIYNRFFNIMGQHVMAPEIDPRVMGIWWENLDQIPNVLGIAAGKKKVAAILGAIRSGLIDILITDDTTAIEVLRLAQKIPLLT
jgi:deoxyribonucleoside regulator